MTDRSDLKRRVRDRQARTGESYMTALRHVRGQRAGAVPVVELLDISDIGAVLGIKCRTLVLPALAERVDVGAMLRQLHAALLATTRDPASQLMRAVVLYGERPFASPSGIDEGSQFLRRVRAGVGGFSETGRALSFAVAGRRGVELRCSCCGLPRCATSTPRRRCSSRRRTFRSRIRGTSWTSCHSAFR